MSERLEALLFKSRLVEIDMLALSCAIEERKGIAMNIRSSSQTLRIYLQWRNSWKQSAMVAYWSEYHKDPTTKKLRFSDLLLWVELRRKKG